MPDDLQSQIDRLRSEMETLRSTIPTKGEGGLQVNGNVITLLDTRGNATGGGDGNSAGTPVTMEIIENGVAYFYAVQAVFIGPV